MQKNDLLLYNYRDPSLATKTGRWNGYDDDLCVCLMCYWEIIIIDFPYNVVNSTRFCRRFDRRSLVELSNWSQGIGNGVLLINYTQNTTTPIK